LNKDNVFDLFANMKWEGSNKMEVDYNQMISFKNQKTNLQY